MKQLIYSFLACLCCLSQGALAQTDTPEEDRLTAVVTEVQPRRSWLVTVTLSSTAASNYTAFQMDIHLPDGFSYVAGSATPGLAIPTHTVAAALHPDGFLRIAAYSAANLAISSGEKPLVSFTLEPDDTNMPEGTYSLAFSNILFSTRTGTERALADTDAQLSCSAKQLYHIIYMADGKVYADVEVEEEAGITPPEAPTKEGHTFEGWDGLPETMPAEDITVTARFSVNSYTASYFLNNDLYATESVAYGSAPTPPEVTAPTGYTFNGWKDVPATMPAHDISIYGTLTAITGIETLTDDRPVDVYTLQGILIRRNVQPARLSKEIPAGLYIIAGRLIYIR